MPNDSSALRSVKWTQIMGEGLGGGGTRSVAFFGFRLAGAPKVLLLHPPAGSRIDHALLMG